MIHESNIYKALADIFSAVFKTKLWAYLAWNDIKQRYSRSLIGPFWLTLSTAFMLLAMGPIYGRLLNQKIGPYFQFLSISFVIWGFIASQITESCTAFISAEGYIKQVKQPLFTHVLRTFTRNTIIFAHNLVVVIIVICIFPPDNFKYILLAPIGFILVVINLLWICLLLAIISSRFRDISQVITSLMTLLFFVTPVVWKPELLGGRTAIVEANFVYHLIEVIRTPIIGQAPSYLSWLVALGAIPIGWGVTLLLFSKTRSRIAYWI